MEGKHRSTLGQSESSWNSDWRLLLAHGMPQVHSPVLMSTCRWQHSTSVTCGMTPNGRQSQ